MNVEIMVILMPDGTAHWRKRSDPDFLGPPMDSDKGSRVSFAIHESRLPKKDEG